MRIAMVCALLSCYMLFIGCSADAPAVQDISDMQQEQPQPLEIVISHNQTIGTPEDMAAGAMKTKLQTLLGDRVNVTVYADYQLGGAREQMEALQLGRIHITIQSVSVAAQLAEDLGVFSMPYLFPADREVVIDFLNSPLGQEALTHIDDTYGEQFKGLGLWFGGYKLLTFHGDDCKTIQSPADYRGLTIATSGATIINAQYSQWGASTITVAAGDLYSTLAQHMADGTEATAQQIVGHHLQEVQRTVVQTYHSPELYVVLANAQWYRTLPADIQQAIVEAEVYAEEILYRTLEEQETKNINTIAQWEGVDYRVQDETQTDVFRQSVQSLYTSQLAGNRWMMEYAEKIMENFPETTLFPQQNPI